MSKENFSLESLNPINKLKEFGKQLLIWILEIIVVGVVCLSIMKKCGLMDEAGFKNYIIYFLTCSIALYILTFAYFAYKSRSKKFDFPQLAKVSVLGPAVALVHVAVLIASTFIMDVPEIGLILYGLIWSSIGVVLVTGITYTFGSSIILAVQ